ncbi:MAG: hypothetical protein ABSG22_06885 [Sedimentisphaerales bacterium]
MRTLRTLIIAAAIAMLAVPAMATPSPSPLLLSSGSCPVNLKIMPIATVVAPPAINVAISTISEDGRGSSSGADYGTFILTTNLASLCVNAGIQTPGISGGHWTCLAEGSTDGFKVHSKRLLYGPFTNVPFNVFVKVHHVPMAANVWSNNFVYDTTLTLTLSAP